MSQDESEPGPQQRADDTDRTYWQPRFALPSDPQADYEQPVFARPPVPGAVPHPHGSPDIPAATTIGAVIWLVGSVVYGVAGAVTILMLTLLAADRALSLTVGLLFIAIMAIGIWIGVGMLRGRTWARTTATAVCGLATASTTLSQLTAGTPNAWAIVLGCLVPLITLMLLWVPASSRFFSTGRASAAGQSQPSDRPPLDLR